ncbi:hypothetical protein J3E69DRAFT_34748 [Trichoderma sp. SZMC 28015]
MSRIWILYNNSRANTGSGMSDGSFQSLALCFIYILVNFFSFFFFGSEIRLGSLGFWKLFFFFSGSGFAYGLAIDFRPTE